MEKMKIAYVVIPDEQLASFRYRVRIPGQELARMNHTVSFGFIDPQADIYFFYKHFNEGDVDIAKKLKRGGKKIIFDISDNHFEKPVGRHYRKMVGLADVVTVPTVIMRDVVQAATGKVARVIDDPYEFGYQPPRFAPNLRTKLLWFGHPSNLDSLMAEWPRIAGDNNILVVTNPAAVKGLNVTPWNRVNMLHAFNSCDIVIIPSKPGSGKDGKSTNRMVESIRQGRYVCANWLQSYAQFGDWMWLGDIKDGIEWAKENPKKVIDNIKGAQKYVEQRFSPENIALKWENVFMEAKHG